jgi:hypothetical protein
MPASMFYATVAECHLNRGTIGGRQILCRKPR